MFEPKCKQYRVTGAGNLHNGHSHAGFDGIHPVNRGFRQQHVFNDYAQLSKVGVGKVDLKTKGKDGNP